MMKVIIKKTGEAVDAFQLTDSQRVNGGPFPDWAVDHLDWSKTEKIHNSEKISVVMSGINWGIVPGDWVVKSVNGLISPCKENEFAKTYSIIEEPTAIS